MLKPLVTLAIPTYNRADSYLRETLESALNQTYENIEIFISDNCSTDKTPDLVKSYSDPRIKYIRQEKNLGQRGNSNFLVNAAAGDYFLLLHDDDLIDEDFTESCMESANYSRHFGLILTGSRVIDGEGNILRKKENITCGLDPEELIISWYKKKVHLFLSCSLFNTNTLRMVGGFDEKYDKYDDVAAEFKCISANGKADVKSVKSSFREHPGSQTSSSDLSSWCESSLELLDLAYSLASSREEELRNYAHRTSAERVYRYASEADGKFAKIFGFLTVYKYFKVSPPLEFRSKLLPF